MSITCYSAFHWIIVLNKEAVLTQKQKLELTWIGKNNSEYDIANIEPRILEENPDLSYGDPKTENMIIHGDNLLALKALLPEYEGQFTKRTNSHL